MTDDSKRDWQQTRIHFVCGVILGAMAAFGLGGGWLPILSAGLIVGILAAIFMDKVWDRFSTRRR